MLHNAIRILNFDNSITSQAGLLSSFQHQIIELSSLAGGLRLFGNDKTERLLVERIRGTDNCAPTFLGSGDFHHVSQVLINCQPEIRSVIVFDFHPDWDILPPHFGCGSWVSRLLKNKNIEKCVLIGVSSNDLSSFALQSADLSALKDNRLEIYPWRHNPSRVCFREVPSNISLRTKNWFFSKKIYWEQLENINLDYFINQLIKRLPEGKVYISIDKDCLSRPYALTNWEEGFLQLDQLLFFLNKLKVLDIAGLDITGDYSQLKFPSRFKAILSRLDHPGVKTPICEESARLINQETNLKILKTLGL